MESRTVGFGAVVQKLIGAVVVVVAAAAFAGWAWGVVGKLWMQLWKNLCGVDSVSWPWAIQLTVGLGVVVGVLLQAGFVVVVLNERVAAVRKVWREYRRNSLG